MYKETYDGTLGVCLAICKGFCAEHTLGGCGRRVNAVLANYPWMDKRSVAEVKAEADYLVRKGFLLDKELPAFLSRNLDGVMKAFNRAYKRRWVKTKGKYVKDVLAVNRQLGKVFYLVSAHQKPQPAHKDVQGTVLVDRFWREALAKVHPELVGEVAKYIKKNKVKSVQWAMGEPVWLITRVNCRHYLMAVDTETTLASSVNELRKRFQKKPTGVHRPITDEERYKELLQLKRAVLRRCSEVYKKRG